MRRNSLLCMCLVLVWQSPQARAQQPAAPPQGATQSTPQAPVQAPTPAPTPASRAATPVQDTYQTSDGAVSFGVLYWYNPVATGIRTGEQATATNPSVFDFNKIKKGSAAASLGLPIGRYHTLRVSYFRTQASGNKTIDNDINLFGVDYLKGQVVSNSYTMQNAKMSLDYTSWPFPVNNSRIRIKTLWEVQYFNMRASTDAPLEPTEDADGNFVAHAGGKTHWFIYPSLGLGAEYFISRNFRFEARGSGFAIPGHSNIWDADAGFSYRATKKWEVNFGGKAFHFKTSPKSEEYYKGTLPGFYFGMRWYPG